MCANMESLTKVQQTIVEEFAAKHQVSLDIALRFLLGRKWDRDRADTLLANYKKLREDKGFDHLSVTDVLDELKTGKLTILGSKAKDGSTLLMIDALKHTPGQFPDESTLKLSFFMAEAVTSTVDAQRDGISILCFMEDLTWEQSDYAFYRDVITLFQDNFPCRVKNIFVFSPPWWISMLIAFASPYMKPKMRERIHIVTTRESLLEWIDINSLPKELDGELSYDHDAFIRRQMAKSSTAKITGILSGNTTADMEEIDLSTSSGQVADQASVSEELAKELVEERERAVEELEMAIRKRRSSLNSQQAPIDFTKLARSKAARLTVSLADSMPVVTPIAAPPLETFEKVDIGSESEILDVETVNSEDETLPYIADKSEDEQHVTLLETIPEERIIASKGLMELSDEDEEKAVHTSKQELDEHVDVERLDEDDSKQELQTMEKPKSRKRGSRKPRPTAIQM